MVAEINYNDDGRHDSAITVRSLGRFTRPLPNYTRPFVYISASRLLSSARQVFQWRAITGGSRYKIAAWIID